MNKLEKLFEIEEIIKDIEIQIEEEAKHECEYGVLISFEDAKKIIKVIRMFDNIN